MQQTDMNIFLQSLRGNQPMIVLAFLLVRSSLTVEQLEGLTGLHNDTVRAAVKGLSSKGLLYKQVGEHGRAVWIPAGDTFFGQLFDVRRSFEDGETQNPKTSDSGALVVVNVESEESRLNKATTLTNRRQNPKTSDSGGKILSVKTIVKAEEDIRECMAVLREAGIYGRKADEIADDWHITAEMIRGHLMWANSEAWDNANGMAIYRLINHVELPEMKSNGHAKSCTCVTCKVLNATRRYSDSFLSAGGTLADNEDESEDT